MDLLSTTEAAQKMGHLINLRGAVRRAEELAQRKPSHRNAVLLQRAQRDLIEFADTMRPRLVQ